MPTSTTYYYDDLKATITVVTDDLGNNWYSISELATILGYTTNLPITRHLHSKYRKGADLITELGLHQVLIWTAKPTSKDLHLWIIQRILSSPRNKIPTHRAIYSPTELGAMLEPRLTGARVNKILSDLGYQVRDEAGRWVPTKAGEPLCNVIDIGINRSNGVPITQIKWVLTAIGDQ